VYASDKYSNTLIGEAELKLCDVTPRQPVTTWLTLTDTGQVSSRGQHLIVWEKIKKTAAFPFIVIKESKKYVFCIYSFAILHIFSYCSSFIADKELCC
jgi:hypothetical protein